MYVTRFERRASGLFAPAVLDGPSGKRSVSIRAPAGGGGSPGHPNEPAGYSQVFDNEWNTQIPSGWTLNNGGSRLSVPHTDATAPMSPSNVARGIFPLNWDDGSSPFSIAWYDPPGYDTLYTHFAVKLSDPFTSHPSSGTTKIIWFSRDNNHHRYLKFHGIGDGPCILRFQTQNISPNGNGTYVCNQSSGSITRGQWYEIEMWVGMGAGNGASDGAFKLWKDGVLCMDYSGIPLTGSGEGNGVNNIKWEPTWGGNTGERIPQEQYMDMDHWYLSAP